MNSICKVLFSSSSISLRQHCTLCTKNVFPSSSLTCLSQRSITKTAPPSIIRSPFASSQSSSSYHSDEDKTVVTVLNQESGAPLMIDTFSQTGFRLNNGLAVVGSIAIFPRSILSWHVKSSSDVTEESLSLFHRLAPKLDLLIFGKGDSTSPFDLKLMTFMKSKGISMEVLPTDKAVAIFNFLNDEGRCVAGAFIPPENVQYNHDDVKESIERKRDLYQASFEAEQ